MFRLLVLRVSVFIAVTICIGQSVNLRHWILRQIMTLARVKVRRNYIVSLYTALLLFLRNNSINFLSPLLVVHDRCLITIENILLVWTQSCCNTIYSLTNCCCSWRVLHQPRRTHVVIRLPVRWFNFAVCWLSVLHEFRQISIPGILIPLSCQAWLQSTKYTNSARLKLAGGVSRSVSNCCFDCGAVSLIVTVVHEIWKRVSATRCDCLSTHKHSG